jgi:predicted ATP-grasp superfamily ATP-dependent carboligase
MIEVVSLQIFVHEYTVGGGFAEETIPPGLLPEGYAMLSTLLTELRQLKKHEILISLDYRLQYLPLPADKIIPVPKGQFEKTFDYLVQQSEAVFLIAPETGGMLAYLTEKVQEKGKILLGADVQSVKIAADKFLTYQLLKNQGIPVPESVYLSCPEDLFDHGHHLNYPLVLKPIDGVGCTDVYLISNHDELKLAFAKIQTKANTDRQPFILQEFVEGTPASVSLLVNGPECFPLTLNSQNIKKAFHMEYLGGVVPLEHPLAEQAFSTAKKVCSLLKGLKGYVGVDLILTDREAVVVEINPRLTTSYCGIAKASAGNLAELIIAACCHGKLPDSFSLGSQVDFSATKLPSLTER